MQEDVHRHGMDSDTTWECMLMGTHVPPAASTRGCRLDHREICPALAGTFLPRDLGDLQESLKALYWLWNPNVFSFVTLHDDFDDKAIFGNS